MRCGDLPAGFHQGTGRERLGQGGLLHTCPAEGQCAPHPRPGLYTGGRIDRPRLIGPLPRAETDRRKLLDAYYAGAIHVTPSRPNRPASAPRSAQSMNALPP